jgi:drug/metabolite transporter (DMT)-like permease
MHDFVLPLFAALACSICNGTAAVLQKVSADREEKTDSMDVGFLFNLFQDPPYIIGVVLDFLGWILTVYAVQYLPLFLVEALIAANIVVTIFIERIFLHGHISMPMYEAAGIIIAGLITLALSAAPDHADSVSATTRWLIVLSPLAVGILGHIVARSQKHVATIALAALSGLAFGQTSIIGRIFTFSRPLWHTLYSPLIFGLIASGILGIWLFSTALQRSRASVANASMTGAQTLIPAVVGILVLGDQPRHGLWYVVVAGTILVLTGVSILAIQPKNP